MRRSDGTARDIGIPFPSSMAIRDSSNRLIPTEKPIIIFDWLTVTGPVPRLTDFEDTGGPFFLDEACKRPDPLEDDQSAFFDTTEGIVVLLGWRIRVSSTPCAYIRQLTENRPICAVIGGMHLVGASPYRVQRTIEELQGIGVERLAPAHCTGMPATVALWNAFPGRCLACPVGTRFEFE